jgi:hypothetical protein
MLGKEARNVAGHFEDMWARRRGKAMEDEHGLALSRFPLSSFERGFFPGDTRVSVCLARGGVRDSAGCFPFPVPTGHSAVEILCFTACGACPTDLGYALMICCVGSLDWD